MKNYIGSNADRLDKICAVSQTVLSIFYCPLSLFSFLAGMLAESIIDATDPIYIGLMLTFSWVTVTVPLLCLVCMAVSVRLRRKGKLTASLRLQFLPLFIFLLNMLFWVTVECLYYP